MNYENLFNTLVQKTQNYITANHLKAMVLGISGGIDSTVVAAICKQVSDNTNIPLIGRSLRIKNKDDEFNISEMVGDAFCDDFKAIWLGSEYHNLYNFITQDVETNNVIANGNIQARLRMLYLYHLASINNGIVLDTGNLTEYYLGFWTLHGDVGDFSPLGQLWKTEIYELANWLLEKYKFSINYLSLEDDTINEYRDKRLAMEESINLTPTDGLGISNSDFEQLGASSYNEIDMILQEYIAFKKMCPSCSKFDFFEENALTYTDKEIIKNVVNRYEQSSFKRNNLPITLTRKQLNLFE